MKKYIACELITSIMYFFIAYIVLSICSANKYEWMLNEGEGICGIPRQAFDVRIMQAVISFFY
ncbi:putative membrane protein [Buttiauxella gaviniae ATCC 51604]|uniref:Putative membrane protein n=1 Tax=Buttiauxella gaviniae ATCC 51604 TaxID=1354253 RepID=A0A1B7I5K4_9ENTR|nr:DUF2645 family protein [Buttiauxella gaviniae]OAT23697.1 putative membrane protein [Buttiauxella gaviniae ATCC 51604]